MAKSKLHPLVKKAGFKSNEDFYKKFPTREHYEMAMGGVPKVFPQIQSEKGFFSRAYENVPAPYTNGSFMNGGFPNIHPFPFQPKMPKNGREAFGRPTPPTILGQDGLAVQDQNVYNSTMDAMGSGANYQWPTAPNAPTGPMNMISPPNYGGAYNVYSPPQISRPEDMMPYMYEEEPVLGSQKKKGGAADINQGSEYFTNKLNTFTKGLKNTASKAIQKEMVSKYVVPETLMKKGGFRKQEGGTPDQMQEAKWQAIIELTNQGVIDPEEIAATLNNQGIYQTNADEVAGYLQEYSQGQSTEEDSMQMGGIPKAQYGWGSGYYGGWPGGAYKVKNKFNFYGNPNDQFNASQRSAMSNVANNGTIDPATAKMLKDSGMWYKQDIKNDIWSRIGLARGPKRIHTEFGFGDQPNMGLPADSGVGTTWVGDKLRQLTGPSKKKQARLAEEEAYNANRANQASNAFMQPVQNPIQAASEAQYTQDQAMRTSPAWQDQVQDKKLLPWLEQTAQRLGVTPESLVNQQAPQTGPAPIEAAPIAAPERSYQELDAEYRKAIEDRDRIFKENKINKRGKRRNILGIKYQNGGNNSYINLPPSAATMNALQFNPNDYNQNMDPENLPGYVPQSTLSDDEMLQAIEGNPTDQFGSGMNMTSDATRKQAGDADFWKDINLMNTGTNLAGIPHQERLRKKAKFDNRIENRMSSDEYRNRGDYSTNYGYFRPDQQNVGNMVTGKFGGTFQEGGQYDLTEEEIQRLRDGGYDVEYI